MHEGTGAAIPQDLFPKRLVLRVLEVFPVQAERIAGDPAERNRGMADRVVSALQVFEEAAANRAAIANFRPGASRFVDHLIVGKKELRIRVFLCGGRFAPGGRAGRDRRHPCVRSNRPSLRESRG